MASSHLSSLEWADELLMCTAAICTPGCSHLKRKCMAVRGGWQVGAVWPQHGSGGFCRDLQGSVQAGSGCCTITQLKGCLS
jgi:hypothetical protein